eukprot:4846263-Heterocapsa_arctica.AAC.1
MLSCELLWMLFQDACGGGSHDERHQRRNGGCDWRLESESVLETGTYTCEDRAHRNFPCDQTDTENNDEQTRSRHIIERGSKDYHNDEKEGFQLLCGRGNEEIR